MWRFAASSRLLVVVVLLVAQAASAIANAQPSHNVIRQFLHSCHSNDKQQQQDKQPGQFHVQGWRWHTMSLVREADRLAQLAQRTLPAIQVDDDEDEKSSSSTKMAALKQAVDYVVGFNMKGLHKIERDLFLPWARQVTQKKLRSNDESVAVAKAFGTVLDQLEQDRKAIQKLGASLNQDAERATSANLSRANRSKVVLAVATKSARIAQQARSMLQLEDDLLVPLIAQVVPEAEQKSISNKVIRHLGILDSRLLLVGMHQAVVDSKSRQEMALFKQNIPSIPQRLIPRWKRLLYQPRVGDILDPPPR